MILAISGNRVRVFVGKSFDEQKELSGLNRVKILFENQRSFVSLGYNEAWKASASEKKGLILSMSGPVMIDGFGFNILKLIEEEGTTYCSALILSGKKCPALQKNQTVSLKWLEEATNLGNQVVRGEFGLDKMIFLAGESCEFKATFSSLGKVLVR